MEQIDKITLRECLLALGYISGYQEETEKDVNYFLTDLLGATKSGSSLEVFVQRFPNYETLEARIIEQARQDAADAKDEAIQRGLFL